MPRFTGSAHARTVYSVGTAQRAEFASTVFFGSARLKLVLTSWALNAEVTLRVLNSCTTSILVTSEGTRGTIFADTIVGVTTRDNLILIGLARGAFATASSATSIAMA
jgi:hypothetical protein